MICFNPSFGLSAIPTWPIRLHWARGTVSIPHSGLAVKSQLFRTPYGNYFCRFLSFALPCFLLKLAVVVGFSSTIALDLHQIQNDGVMNDAIYRRHRGHRVFEDLIPLAKNQIRRNDHRFVFIALGEEREEHFHLVTVLLYIADVIENNTGKFIAP